jgi:hypothetical protein
LRYPLNQPVRLSTTVRQLNIDGTTTLANATTLTLLVKTAQAGGTWLTTGTYSTPVNDGTGTYHQDIPAADLAAAGHYQYAWTATGTGAGVSFGEFDVFDPFEVRVISLQDAKDMLNIPQATTTHDAELDGWIAAVESGLERRTGGPVVTRAFTERCELDGTLSVLLLRQRPVVSVQSIVAVASGQPVSISGGLDIDNLAGTVRTALGWPFTGPFWRGRPVMLVTYTAGWGVSVPAAFRSFAEIVIQHLWSTRRGPVAAMPMAGDALVTVPGFGYAVPNAAAELLDGSQDGIPFTLEAYI